MPLRHNEPGRSGSATIMAPPSATQAATGTAPEDLRVSLHVWVLRSGSICVKRIPPRSRNARYITLHHGAARTPGASHSSVLPVCRRSAARDFRPYSARKLRRWAASESRGRDEDFTSIGSKRPPVSMTKSTSSPVAVRQYPSSARSSRASRHASRSSNRRFSRCAPDGSSDSARCSATPVSPQ